MDKSVLWTEDVYKDGVRAIRTVTHPGSNQGLHFDASGASDGTVIVAAYWVETSNSQRWKTIPWNVIPPSKNIVSALHCCCPRGALTSEPTVRIFTMADGNYSLSIRGSNVILAPSNPRDELQHWIKDMRYSTIIKDENGFLSFALVNKAMGLAIRHSIAAHHPLRLVPYTPDFDESILWTESSGTGDGFRCIRKANNTRLNFDAFGAGDNGRVLDGTVVGLWEWLEGKNQIWKIVPY